MKIRSIKQKLLLSIGGSTLLVGLAVAASFYGIYRVAGSGQFLDRDVAQLTALNGLYRNSIVFGNLVHELGNAGSPSARQRVLGAMRDAAAHFDQDLDVAIRTGRGNKARSGAFNAVSGLWQQTHSAGMLVGSLADGASAQSIAAVKSEGAFQWLLDAALNGLLKVQSAQIARDEAALPRMFHRTIILSAGLTLSAAIVAALIVLWSIGRITRRVMQLCQSMESLSEGDADLTRRIPIETDDEIGQTAHAFNRFVTGLQGLIAEISVLADNLSASAPRLLDAATHVNASSQAQSEAISASASGIEQITVSANMVKEHTDQVAGHSDSCLSRSKEGNESLSALFGTIDTVEGTVNHIAQSAEKFIQEAGDISRLTQEVRSIAEQTNLLALNAAIEAARAGEHGRGFAVVADEVRKLAEKSATSSAGIDVVTRAITEQSQVLQETVKEGVESLRSSQGAAEHVATVMAEAHQSVRATSDGLGSIANSVSEQTAALTEVAANVEKIAQMAEENNATAASVSKDAAALSGVAGELRQCVGRFRYQ
ncbi:MAG: methyl-accepting chemotaxis protein [Betaproteobacteria bacterium]|nr:methyl-accepting chemotaxis protein [Betaproteobacteria bacterium]